jgi:RNase adaptor protein for sRNA GlmZ degradation
MFGRPSRGTRRKLAEAQAVQSTTAEAFARMDRAQQDLRLVATTPEAAALDAEAEDLARRYLAALDAHPVHPGTELSALYAAILALREVTAELTAMAERLEAAARG